ncbi:hypothetical protein AKG11_24575 [Shinella sp. SUS2]|uniref:hypothetical protein n=1 Tax=unclassified Shinella TaxID=2643062 RepID=UPI0006825353|nr:MULTISPECIES: hypothetical protein [unclassified Shinella]KNY14375.1 hypothetical protein AKG11_24575 [Shinella sp. SUS2]KOC73174.1 hypothetical protein AKG10_23745 [Shinella sp. GWS1]
MDAEYFKSWKFAFTLAAGFTILMTGYKMAVRPDLPTRLAESRAAAAFPEGEPSSALRGKLMTEGMTSLSLNFTLDEFERYMRSNNNEIVWEPENDRSFVVVATRVDPLTQVMNEMAFQMKVRQPSELPNFPHFASGAISITAIAFNAEMVDPRVAQNLLFQMQTDIELRRQRGAL